MLPEFEFRVNVRYDSEFRSRDANQRLRRAHPKVKKIHATRDTAKQSRDGNSYVTVTCAAPTKAIAKACFDDGNSEFQKDNQIIIEEEELGAQIRGAEDPIPEQEGKPLQSQDPRHHLRKYTTRPTVFPEEVTRNNWGEYMQRCDEYKEKHPEFRVIC